MPTMSLCPSTLQLTPLVCLGLLCLLFLLTDSTVSKKGSSQLLNTRQANCSAAFIPGGLCSPGDNDNVSVNATDLQLKGHLKGEQADQFPIPNSLLSISQVLNNSVALIQPSTTPAAHTEPTSSAGAATTAATQPVGNVVPTASLGTSANTTAPPSAATTATSTTATSTTATSTTLTTTKTTAITTPPSAATSATSTTATFTTTATSTAAATAPHPATSVKARTRLTTANPTVAMTATTGTKMSPPPPPSAATPHHAPSTGKPPIETSPPTGPTTITTTSPSTPTGRSVPVAAGPRVPVVDVAGAPLTKQLVDTASLLSVLLFGLLFFLVTVAVFVTQAYDSYRRKDYTQVDYLINGMYSDSGV
ncbi:uncharacterized protein C11orf24 homolog isoform X2 [Perca flavescens]|uniref:uncharacterized protein C11orf24 homolog isoform X2 n=1 Tax=Perca flavescens TaxID=8167 RepID=UPI00106EACA1|nr:uncharacterized protein C11orf24 homolog isoform X2 [Perca flavescens]